MSKQGSTSASFGLPEDIYGHAKRLEWIRAHLRAGDRILEIGCGTGYMIVLPLLLAGWDVLGVDRDEASIRYGQDLLAARNLEPQRLKCMDGADLQDSFDVVILSEVLEHLSDTAIAAVLSTAHRLLNPGGRLLVTVPNGWGAFEMEMFLWQRMGLGWLLATTRFDRVVCAVKRLLAGGSIGYDHPSSLDCSPHCQRFTLRSITHLINDAGFHVVERTGTVMVAGPLSNLLLTGVLSVMRANAYLGSVFPAIASGFMLCAQQAEDGQGGHS